MRGDFFATMLMVLVVWLVVMLILRELACWYWKINEVVGLLTAIKGEIASLRNTGIVSARSAEELQQIREQSRSIAQQRLASPPVGDVEYCPFCNEKSPKRSQVCEACGNDKRTA
jgi:hypothetical protein